MEIKKRALLTRAVLRSVAWPAYWKKRLTGGSRNGADRPKPSRIALFVSMELLGGGIIISSMVKAIRQLYPEATVYIVGEHHRSGKLEGFFKKHSWVDELIICPPRDNSTIRDWIKFYRKLRSYKLDMAVLSPNHSCSDSVWLHLCGIPEIVGCYLPKTWDKLGLIENLFLTGRLTERQIGDGPYRLLNFPEAYARTITGRDDLKIEELVPYIRYEDTVELPREGAKVTLHPGGPSIKRWPVEKFIELGKRLAQVHDAALYIIGGKPEAHLAKQITEGIIEDFPQAKVVNCCGCSLNDSMAYIAHSTIYVGNNTGPVQIAVALGVPVVGVFREQDRWFSGPDAAGDRHYVVSRPDLNNLSVDEVWSVIERLWPESEQAHARRFNLPLHDQPDLSVPAS
ncbi:MAG TPA: glycosyltransferase family 9 protein [Acidobacteriota bacterium]|nr:glycosyltransferase family 9 protein [Acidobacteriota bacterium]